MTISLYQLKAAASPDFLQRSYPVNRSRRSSRQRIGGFTLIETLATLTVFAIVMALLSASLFQVAHLANLSETQTTQSRDDVIRISWFKTTVGGSVNDWVDGSHWFRGEARKISGLTVLPLQHGQAGRTVFSWRISYNPDTGMSELRYWESDMANTSVANKIRPDEILVHAWSGDSGRFSYLQGNGEFTEAWPVLSAENSKLPSVPFGVLLEYGEQPQSAFSSIRDRSFAPVRAKDI